MIALDPALSQLCLLPQTIPSVSSKNMNDIGPIDTASSSKILDAKTKKRKKKSTILSRLRAFGGRAVEEDPNLFHSDVFVVCVGPMGAGKSSFIEKAADVQHDIVGHGLGLKTKEIESFELCLPELVHSKIILVDTPGFDNTNEDEIMSKLRDWLSTKGNGTVYVLYFHPISNKRLTMGTLSWRHFRSICRGKFDRVILVTTMWDKVRDIAQGVAREEEMKEICWTAMIEGGSPVKHFLNNRTSTLEILGPIIKDIDETTSTVLSTRLRAKLHELKMSLKRNSASLRFLQDIEYQASDCIKKGEELRSMFRQQVCDPEARRQLIEEYRQASEDIQSRFKDAKKLTKSGNIFQKLGALVNLERLLGIFSNRDKSQPKGMAPPVGEDLLQRNNSS